jgi:hypothetical protein
VQRPIASPPAATSVNITDLSCASPTNCMTVGSYRPTVPSGTNAPLMNLAEFWNGRTWRLLAPPDPLRRFQRSISTPESNEFASVSCPTVHWCAAVGNSDINDDLVHQSFAMIWDGSHWTVTRSRLHALGNLGPVSCASRAFCMAIGTTAPFQTTSSIVADQWNGHTWSPTAPIEPKRSHDLIFGDVSCPTSHTCVATGGRYDDEGAAFGAVWHRGVWTMMPAIPRGLGPINCLSSSDCLASGLAGKDSDTYPNGVFASWNGRAWTRLPLPLDYYGRPIAMGGVSCPTTQICMAFGYSYAGSTLGWYWFR